MELSALETFIILNWSRQQVTMLSLYLQLLKTGASYWNIIQYPVSNKGMCSWGSVNNWELYGASHLQELALLGQMNMMKSQNCFPTLSSDVLYRSICTKVYFNVLKVKSFYWFMSFVHVIVNSLSCCSGLYIEYQDERTFFFRFFLNNFPCTLRTFLLMSVKASEAPSPCMFHITCRFSEEWNACVTCRL